MGRVVGVDHLSFPTRNTQALLAFYSSIGVRIDDADSWRRGEKMVVSMLIGDVKIHVHTDRMLEHVGEEWFVRADAAVPGSLDVCLVWEGGVDLLLSRLRERAIPVVLGPIARVGGRNRGSALGISVYVRDPDGNLIELISYNSSDVQRYSDSDG